VGNKNTLPTLQLFDLNNIIGGQQKHVTHPTII